MRDSAPAEPLSLFRAAVNLLPRGCHLHALSLNPFTNCPAYLLGDRNTVPISNFLKGFQELAFKAEIGLLEWRHVYTCNTVQACESIELEA